MHLKLHENKHQVGKSSGMKEQLDSLVPTKGCSREVAPAAPLCLGKAGNLYTLTVLFAPDLARATDLCLGSTALGGEDAAQTERRSLVWLAQKMQISLFLLFLFSLFWKARPSARGNGN